jgi:Tol biopolymer transport system component
MNSADGSNQKPLTKGGSDFNPSVTPDNQFVVYENQSGGTSTIWKVSIDGGNPVQLLTKYSAAPAVSPDGQFIACRYYIAPNIKGVAIVPFTGGEPTKQFPIPIINWQRVRWGREGDSLTYVDSQGNNYNIWNQPLTGGSRKMVTNFKDEQIFSYDWSPDFTQLASQRGTEISDVFIIRLPS